MTFKVAVPAALSQVGKDYLVNHDCELIETKDQSAAVLASEASDADGIVLMTEPFPNTLKAQLPKLKVIARHGVGYDNVDQDFWAEQGIWVTITPNANASTVAETTLTAMMALSKNLVANVDHLKRGHWNWAGQHKGFDLADKVLGIMGYGRIGRMVAKKASALDMKVIAYDPFAKSDEYANLVDRDTLLKTADVITLHMLVTPATTHSIGAREFTMMKSNACLLNFGRAALVDQKAMQKALTEGEIAMAAVDVYDHEPLDKDDPWLKVPNVLLTPHIASNTEECMARMAVDSASEVVRVLHGEQPLWSVNQPNGK
jgi:D-3-phosphoglycerate dehydrogenase